MLWICFVCPEYKLCLIVFTAICNVFLIAIFYFLVLIWRVNNNIPTQCNFLLEFPEILSQNLLCCHCLSVSGNSEIMHCGILLNIKKHYQYWLIDLGFYRRFISKHSKRSHGLSSLRLTIVNKTDHPKDGSFSQ